MHFRQRFINVLVSIYRGDRRYNIVYKCIDFLYSNTARFKYEQKMTSNKTYIKYFSCIKVSKYF